MNRLDEIIAVPCNQDFDDIFFNKVKSLSTDSRSLKKGDIFLALKGQTFDGHDHIAAALDKGASYAISEKKIDGLDERRLCLVENTLNTYHQIASLYIKILNPLVVAITGSSGKTTSKEMLYSVLSQKFRVHATEKNFNNEIGVPKTILEMPEDTQILILEMGMRGLGEITLLSQTGRPNISIVTNIGSAHIERLGSIENIRKAKMEITNGMQDYCGWSELKSSLVIDSSNKEVLEANGFNFSGDILVFNSTPKYKLNALESPGLNADANAVAQVASLLGLTEEEIRTGLLAYSPERGRGKLIKDNSDNLYIDDSYNANPESTRNSIQALMNNFPKKKKIAVIGEIAESSKEMITELFTELTENPNLDFIDARSLSIEEIKVKLKTMIDGNSVVLVKASRSAALEKLFHGSNFTQP